MYCCIIGRHCPHWCWFPRSSLSTLKTVDTSTNWSIEVNFTKLGHSSYQGNKEALKNLINSAEALDENIYTSESWINLIEEIQKAKDVYNDENAMQDEVDNAVESLKAAINNLIKVNDLLIDLNIYKMSICFLKNI